MTGKERVAHLERANEFFKMAGRCPDEHMSSSLRGMAYALIEKVESEAKILQGQILEGHILEDNGPLIVPIKRRIGERT
jgi:hypothetical protein